MGTVQRFALFRLFCSGQHGVHGYSQQYIVYVDVCSVQQQYIVYVDVCSVRQQYIVYVDVCSVQTTIHSIC